MPTQNIISLFVVSVKYTNKAVCDIYRGTAIYFACKNANAADIFKALGILFMYKQTKVP